MARIRAIVVWAVAVLIGIGFVMSGCGGSGGGGGGQTGNPGAVAVINSITGDIEAIIPVNHDPRALAFTPNGAAAFVIHDNGEMLTINTSTFQTSRTNFTGASKARGLAVSQGFLYSTGLEDALLIELASGNLVDMYEMTDSPHNSTCFDAAATADNDGYFSVNAEPGPAENPPLDHGNLYEFRNGFLLPHKIRDLRRQVAGLATTASRSRLYAANYATELTHLPGNYVSVIDPTTLETPGDPSSPATLVAEISVGTQPIDVFLHPFRNEAYVPCLLSDDVWVIDTSTNAVIDTIEVGSRPTSFAFRRDGSVGYVANSASKTISCIDVDSRTVTSTTNVPGTPLSVVASPTDDLVFVVLANYNGTDFEHCGCGDGYIYVDIAHDLDQTFRGRGFGPGQSLSMGANDAGEVVGRYGDANGTHAFLWNNGVVTDLGIGQAAAINGSGQITGQLQFEGPPGVFQLHAFLWTPTTPNGSIGTTLDLGALGPLGNDEPSMGLAINDSGIVVGSTGEVSTEHAFVANPSMSDLGVLSGTTASVANSINASGQIVGQSRSNSNSVAVIWNGGVISEIGAGISAVWKYATSINASGKAMIVTEDPEVFGYLWESGQPIQVLGGGVHFFAKSINDPGTIAGWAEPHAGILMSGGYTGLPQGIEGPIFGGLPPNTGIMTVAYITHTGRIVGQNAVGGNSNHAYLLIPMGIYLTP